MGFYKGTFFWIYLYFSTIYVLFILNLDFLNERQSLFSGSIVLKGTVITFIIFFFLLFIFFVLKSIITSEVQSRDFRRKGLMSFFIRDYPFAVNFVDSLTKNFLHTQCEFDPPFIKNYGEKFYNVFGLDYRVHSKQNYWLSKFYVMEKSEYLNKQLSYWEKIYRFSKSLAAAFGLAAIYCSLSIFFQEDVLKKLGAVYYYEIEVSHILPLILLGLNLITLQYYIYIYDNRYSRLIFRTFIAAVATDEFEFRKQAILTGSQKKSFVLKRDR